MPQRGGKRTGAGRKPGSKTRATKRQKGTIEEIARRHCKDAIESLAEIAKAADSDHARVAACQALLDRGYGKPRQAMEVTGKDGEPLPCAPVIYLSGRPEIPESE